MIIEMMGRPAAHLTEAIEKHVGVLNDVEDMEVHSIKVSEPKKLVRGEGEKEVAKENEMFTAFAEAEFEIPDLSRLSQTVFDFMPSSIEIIEPSRVNLEATEATDLLNNLSGRLHRYDEIAKIAGERLRQMSVQLEATQKVLLSKDKEIAELKKDSKKVKKKAKKKK